MATPKKKPLTQREKKLRAEIRAEWREKGLVPPVKPRLNRKKFVSETWAEFNEFLKSDAIRAETYLLKSIGYMLGPKMWEVTPEAVGVAKLLKMAVETDKFMRALEAEGRSEYTIGELADKVVLPIMKL